MRRELYIGISIAFSAMDFRVDDIKDSMQLNSMQNHNVQHGVAASLLDTIATGKARRLP